MNDFKYRPSQESVIKNIVTVFENGNKKLVILNAPTGYGKSLVNVEIAKEIGSSYYLSPLNSQIDQLSNDKLIKDSLTLLKGKSHYFCPLWENAERAGVMECKDKYGEACEKKVYDCEYYMALFRAVNSPILLTNFMLALIHPGFKKRSLAIIDEAQGIGSFISDLESIDFSERLYPLPLDLSEEVIKKWTEEIIELLRKDIDSTNDPDEKIKIKKRLDKCERFKVSYEPNKYVSYFQEVQEKKGQIRHFTSKPLEIEMLIRKHLERLGERIIISSATPPYPSEMGFKSEECEIFELPSSFSVKNRLCYYSPVGRMGRKYKDKTIPLMAEAIEKILEKHKGEKCLIHNHSYQNAIDLSRYLKVNRILQNREGREIVEEWKKSNIPVFLSVNFNEGLDLPEDLCRINIILKIPFPDEADPYIKERIKRYKRDWYNKETARKIVQAYGRSTRSDKDYSTCYILDSDFRWFFSENKELFPVWFKEALRKR